MTRLYSFDDHPEHRACLDSWTEKWNRNAISTVPADRVACREAVAGLYRAAGLTPPERIVFVASPMTAAIAGTVAAGVWWVRVHGRLFGRRVSEQVLMAAIRPACTAVVTCGMAALTGEDKQTVPASAGAVIRAATDAATPIDDGKTYAVVETTTTSGRAATRATTRAATHAATYGATHNATRAAIDQATRDDAWSVTHATNFITYDTTRAAINDAVRGGRQTSHWVIPDVYEAIRGEVTSAEGRHVAKFLVRCVRLWARMYTGAAECPSWPAYVSFFRDVAGFDLPEYERWQHFETLARQSGGRMMHEQFCIVTDRQTDIHLDEENRLHNPDGPARTWADGWAVWAWHGIRVPQALVEGRWTPADILREPNAEIRRCAIEHMGWPAFIAAANLQQFGPAAPDPGNPGNTLTLYDIPERIFRAPTRILIAANGTPEPDGTRRQFGLTVPATINDPITAAAWGYDLDPGQYAQAQRRA